MERGIEFWAKKKKSHLGENIEISVFVYQAVYLTFRLHPGQPNTEGCFRSRTWQSCFKAGKDAKRRHAKKQTADSNENVSPTLAPFTRLTLNSLHTPPLFQ